MINGKLPETLQTTFYFIDYETTARFSSGDCAQTADPDSIGLLIVANEAVNEEVVDIEEKYPQKTKSSSEEDPIKEKKPFWERFFR